MNPSDHGTSNPASRQGSIRRPRAPTITIDTSAVSAAPESSESHQLQALTPPGPPEPPQAGNQEQDQRPKPPRLTIDSSSKELHPSSSFESTDSRPTSPHNVSSPTSKWGGQPQNFLSVPTARSRGNSVDSDVEQHSPTSYGGDTFLPSTASSHTEARNVDTAHSNDPLLPDDEALKPDPGTEADFQIENNRFAFSPGQLNKLFNPKSLSAFHALGGLHGLEKGLRTDIQSGLSLDETTLDGNVTFDEVTKLKRTQTSDHSPPEQTTTPHRAADNTKNVSENSYIDRKRIFRDNHLPERPTKSLLYLIWITLNDKILILLCVAAVISLALGIYQSVQASQPGFTGDPGLKVAWVEGVAIVVAILVVVAVGAANDWQKERQFAKLNKKKEDRMVKAIRSGKSKEISVHDILAGDVLRIEAGDVLPVDGIYISGHNVSCDESSATGESEVLRKTPADVVYKAIETHDSLHKMDPFMVSGATVMEGVGTYLVTATGTYSSYGRTLLTLQDDPQITPLQAKLNMLAEYIAKLGVSAGLILFAGTLIRYFVRLNSIGSADQKGQAFLQLFITAVTIIVVAVPEGLPLAVTLALAFATTKMTKDNNLVRQLKACETMGNATTICSDKTGTLTQNKMTVVAGIIGTTAQFGEDTTSADESNAESPSTAKEIGGMLTRTIDDSPAQTMKVLSEDVKDLMKQSIVMNSTAFEAETDGKESFIGSKTETALLLFARDHLGMLSLTEERSDDNVVQLIPFDSKRKCMATVIRMNNGRYRMLVKGASELMLAKCTKIVRDPLRDLMDGPISTEEFDLLNSSINTFASKSLRTIGLLYKEFEEWPPKGTRQIEDPNSAQFEKVFKDMTFLSIVGIKDPLRDGVREAVETCQKAGIVVRMVTGDNMLTAKAIASDCGIYTSGGIVMEGPQFRRLNRNQMNMVLPRLQVLARSSPEDKRILVKRLKDLGETVAVTGDGTNDAPALKIADVGFSMGITGTEIAKEASDIILMDDNFASTVKATMWGRAVNDAVKKFLQFQVTVNITAVVLTFVSAVANSQENSVLTAVQLLWVNLIMDTLAALALATDPPVRSLLDRKPEPKSAPLISITMWKMIIGQAMYQLIVTLVLYFVRNGFPMYTPDIDDNTLTSEVQAVVFNAFVWMQIFNQYNCRRLDNNLNFLEGVTKNYWFMGIQLIIVGGQILIMFVGGVVFSLDRPLTGAQWAVSIILGLISIPIAVFLRLIPDEWLSKLIPKRVFRKKTPDVLVSDEERQFEWNPVIEDIREELLFMKLIRGGRLSVLKYKLQNPRELLPRSRSGSRGSRSASRSRTNSLPRTPQPEISDDASVNHGPPTPESHRSHPRRRGRSRSNSTFGPAAAMAGIVAGSIAGWSPVERRDGDSFGRFPFQDRSDLEGHQGVELHPGTRPDDPVLADPAGSSKPPSQVPETNPSYQGDLSNSKKATGATDS